MAMGINRVVLVGNLVRDPELRHTPGGTAVCEFSIAVNSREKNSDSGEWQDRADFFDVVVFQEQGEACAQYLSKGRPAAVEGRLRQERWEKDGQKRSRVRIVASNVQFLGSKHDDDHQGGGSSDQTALDHAPSADFGGDDDVPF